MEGDGGCPVGSVVGSWVVSCSSESNREFRGPRCASARSQTQRFSRVGRTTIFAEECILLLDTGGGGGRIEMPDHTSSRGEGRRGANTAKADPGERTFLAVYQESDRRGWLVGHVRTPWSYLPWSLDEARGSLRGFGGFGGEERIEPISWPACVDAEIRYYRVKSKLQRSSPVTIDAVIESGSLRVGVVVSSTYYSTIALRRKGRKYSASRTIRLPMIVRDTHPSCLHGLHGLLRTFLASHPTAPGACPR